METYIEPLDMVEDRHFRERRDEAIASLGGIDLDPPLAGLIERLNRLPYCFTLQSCYGHFLFEGRKGPRNLDPLPAEEVEGDIDYRIAYICLCVENSPAGREFLDSLRAVPSIDPGYIQFCCAEWFWRRQVNSYALQVEPDRFKHLDKAVLGYAEAVHVERTRDGFFRRLAAVAAGRSLPGPP
jgi:hypothetical protein